MGIMRKLFGDDFDLAKPISDQVRGTPPPAVPQFERVLFIGGPDDGKYQDVPYGQTWAESVSSTAIEVAKRNYEQRTYGRYVRCDVQLAAYTNVRAALFIYTGLSPDDAFKQLVMNYMSTQRLAKVKQEFLSAAREEALRIIDAHKFHVPALPAAEQTSETNNKQEK